MNEGAMNQSRLSKLTQQTLAHGLDGVALVPGPNMAYISGIHSYLTERPIVLFLPADDDPAIIIPALEAMKARDKGIPEERIFAWNDESGFTGAFQQACAHLELSDYLLAVEALHMRLLEIELLQRYAPGVTIAHAEPVMTELRIVKDDSEIEAMVKATTVAEAAMKRVLPQIKIGMTEKKVASMLTQALMDSGAEKVAFGPIVSAGPNGASPHAVPTSRPLQKGDMLVIDWGAYVDEYPSDITRTFAIGAVEPKMERVYNAVKLANEHGKAAIKPGASGQDIDRAAREVILEAGYGPHFIHRTGHGLGRELHEPPFIMEGNSSPLPLGCVFTVEPGIYLHEKGGVRIEDNLVLTADGARCLTAFSRELMILDEQ
jgi:Xaa-Pro dipeptidase